MGELRLKKTIIGYCNRVVKVLMNYSFVYVKIFLCVKNLLWPKSKNSYLGKEGTGVFYQCSLVGMNAA